MARVLAASSTRKRDDNLVFWRAFAAQRECPVHSPSGAVGLELDMPFGAIPVPREFVRDAGLKQQLVIAIQLAIGVSVNEYQEGILPTGAARAAFYA